MGSIAECQYPVALTMVPSDFMNKIQVVESLNKLIFHILIYILPEQSLLQNLNIIDDVHFCIRIIHDCNSFIVPRTSFFQ